MSYPINQNLNPYKQPPMGLNTPQQLQNVNVTPDKVVQNSALNGIRSEDEDTLFSKKTFLLSLPVAAGMIYGMDKFNGACATKIDGNPNLLDKISNRCEKIGLWLREKVPSLKNFESRTNKMKNNFYEKVVCKMNISSAMAYAPSVPKSVSILMMANGTKAEIAKETISRMQMHLGNGHELKLCNGEEITLKSLEELLPIAHTPEGIDKVIKLCEAQGKDVFIQSKVLKFPFSHKFVDGGKYLSDYFPSLEKNKVFNRKIYFSEYANKMKVFVDPKGTTYLGRKLPQFMIRVLEGLTNGTAGGKIAVLLGAIFIADAVKKTIDAPNKNGEKRKVFAENMISNVGMYMTMPLGIAIMHKFGGLQYLGMGKGKDIKANVANYRKELADFNEKAASGGFKTPNEYKDAKKKLVNMLKGDTKINFKEDKVNNIAKDKILKMVKKGFSNILFKPVKTMARILTVGLETIHPYIPSDASKTKIFFKKLGFNLKRGLGYPVRFGFFMFVIGKVTSDVLAKGSHIIFGRPEKSILDYGKEPKKEQKPQEIVYPEQAQQMLQMQAAQKSQNLANNDMTKTDTNVPRTMVAASEAPARRYIPSDEAVKINPKTYSERDDKVNVALNKADAAEKRANEFVS